MAVEFAEGTVSRSGALYKGPPENIIINEALNGRHEATDLESLIADIEKNGQLIPVQLRKNDKGQPVLIAGHRRWLAISTLNKRRPDNQMEIVGTYRAVTESEGFLVTIAENRERKDVSPIDDAENMRILTQRFSKSPEEIAAIYFPHAKKDAELAEALRFVKQRLALIELAPEAAQAVRDGRLKITAAVALSKMSREQQKAKVAAGGKVKGKDVASAKPAKPEKPDFEALSKKLFTNDVIPDLTNEEVEFMSVARKPLLKIAKALGIVE
jgi:ParB-like chromosome segregation protein Spo0J